MSAIGFMPMGKPTWFKQGDKMAAIFRCRDIAYVGNYPAGSWANSYGSDEKLISIFGIFKNAIAVLYVSDSNVDDPTEAVVLSEFDAPVYSDSSNAFRLHNDGTRVTLQHKQLSETHSVRLSVTIIAK